MSAFESIIGAELMSVNGSSSTYIGVDNDRGRLNVTTTRLVFDIGYLVIENPYVAFDENGVAHSINLLIGEAVIAEEVTETDLILIFTSRTRLSISIRDDDYQSPEAASWTPTNGTIVVLN